MPVKVEEGGNLTMECYIPEATLEVGTKAVEPCEVVKTPEHTDQLFQKIQVTENTEPPVHLFNVKMDTETQKNDQRNVAKLIKTPSIKKQLLQMLVEIIFIAILTVSLYSILRIAIKNDLPLDTTSNEYNFSATLVDTNDLEKLVHNFNDDKKQEMDNIVKKIYNLIETAKNSINSNTTYITTLKEHFRYRNFTQQYNDGIQGNVYLRVYNFIVFIIVYVIVLLYMNNLQAKIVKNTKKPFSKCVMLFAILWLPTIIEMFYRTYIVNKSPNTLSGLLLLLANGNTITQTIQKYAQWTGYTKQNSTVEPLHK
ncbi:uncharacterized protein LOC132696074 isoform X1 [Cylas formicarius]|uniref:uncharacterized protein LOC132696074 isoform X1 n=1 Tax=Cylas formicarius TaxID=197179 RepID=UPI00295887A7|nr:uncharacterized protein LOC132696074 isoform X1 [Cylas formicarius]